MEKIRQAVILAGGLGTRLKPFTDTMPKPMYPINGKPFIHYLLEQVKSFGIDEVILLLGYLPEKIYHYVGDGKSFGLKVKYSITHVDRNTGDRLKAAKALLDDRFLLMYCDNYCPIDFNKHVKNAFKNDADIQLYTYNNKDGYTKSNIKFDNTGMVTTYDKSLDDSDLSGVEIGYAIIKKDVIDLIDKDDCNFSKDIFPRIIEKNKMYATSTEHRYYSIGSFRRMGLTEEFFSDKKVVFLDRDGTLNVRAPKAQYIERPEDFVWLPGAREAIKLLDDNGYTTILVTNQPGIARGNLTVDTLNAIHNKMQDGLAEIGTKIDYIYYCPHNWDEGCDCRKPKPGMFYMAQKDLSINLPESVMFGDDDRDKEACSNANVPGILVNENYPLIDAVKDYIEKDNIKRKMRMK